MPEFKFESLADFAAMSGHGIYVWSCVVIALVILGALLIHPARLKRTQLAKIRRQHQLEQSQRQKHQRSDLR